MKNKSILEKLGITPIFKRLLFVNCDGCGAEHEYLFFKEGEVREIERQRNQMLEALINSVKWFDFQNDGNFHNQDIEDQRGLIESATGKSWEEIKKLA